MGAVYLAEHPVIGSRVAIKFLHPQFSGDQAIVDRFFNEARAVNVIGHDNILKILDLDVTEDNRHYFVMEFLQGHSLQAFVKPDQPLPLEVAGPILLQICGALQAAHDKSIVHRDLKPDNIHLITHDGRKNFVKVVDFGIAKLALVDRDGLSRTQTGIVMGTPAYMSPEQGTGEAEKIDGRSDIYSLGVMMFQMATGKLPFPGQTFAEVLLGHVQRAPPPPRSLDPAIPEDYEAVILKTLAKSRDDRYRSMSELHAAIRACMDARGISPGLPAADPVPASAVAAARPAISAAQGPAAAQVFEVPLETWRSPRTPPPPDRDTAPKAAPAAAPGATRASGPPSAARKRRRGRWAAWGALGGASLLAAAAAFYARRGRSSAPPEPTPPRGGAASGASPVAAGVVVLSAASLPAGARVEATWPGGERAGLAPLTLEVQKGAQVHLAFSRTDCQPAAVELVADESRTVTAPLECPEPVKQPPSPPVLQGALAPPAAAESGAHRRRRGGEKRRAQAGSAKAQTDALIDLGEAFR